MNYYQRIQKSLDFIEDHLDQPLTIELCAKEAYLSVSGFYRLFQSVVGYNVKEYIRRRRLTAAYYDLLTSNLGVLDTAIKYDYTSADSFTRAFKKQFGHLPSKVKTVSPKQAINEFARLNIMEENFESGNKNLEEAYPEIKVLKELKAFKAACFTYFGKDPESHAFEVMKDWAAKHRIAFQDSSYRIFGYNHPDPSNVDDPNEIYGYEVCVTVPDELYDTLEDVPQNFVKGTYDSVKRRTIKGGKYAVLSVKREGKEDIGYQIMMAWKRFGSWMSESKYLWGGSQYLEEHLGFSDEDEHIGGVDLYISIADAPKDFVLEKTKDTIAPTRVALFHTEGGNKEEITNECWQNAITFAKVNLFDVSDCKFYQYNKGFDDRPPYFHTIMIPLPEGYPEENCSKTGNVTFETFQGGTYMTACCYMEQLLEAWMLMEKWRKESKAKPSNHQWVEEWTLTNWDFPYQQIRVCYPIKS